MSSFDNRPIPKLFDDAPPSPEELAVAKQLAADQCLRWSSCGKTTRARLVEQAKRAITAYVCAKTIKAREAREARPEPVVEDYSFSAPVDFEKQVASVDACYESEYSYVLGRYSFSLWLDRMLFGRRIA